MRWTALFAGALLGGSAVLAQPPAQPPAQPLLELPRRYEVEVIVFANRDFDPTEERFDYTPSSFGDGTAAPLREVPVFDETTFAPPPEPVLPVDPLEALREEALKTRVLAPEELELGNEYRRLVASRAYEPLVHAGWVLPGLPEDDATPFDLKTLGLLNPIGTVKVHLINYLHVTLDLTYQASAAGTPTPSSADGLDEIVVGQKYRLTSTRRVTSGELHYFDHPAFGVLVRVTPVPEPGDSGRPAA
jgi:hypothetical protein